MSEDKLVLKRVEACIAELGSEPDIFLFWGSDKKACITDSKISINEAIGCVSQLVGKSIKSNVRLQSDQMVAIETATQMFMTCLMKAVDINDKNKAK